MTAGAWYSQPDRDVQSFGHFDTTAIDDDAVRHALERIKFELEQLNRGCEKPVMRLRAHCWMPDVTPVRYGYYMASFNEMVLSSPLQTGESPVRKVVLPDAALRPGGYVEIVDYGGSASVTNITVICIKGETINGSSTFTINEAYASVQFRSDGANWRVVGKGAGSTAATDHGALTGLGDDDHTQYMLDAGTSTAGNLPAFTNTDGRTMNDSGVAGANVATAASNITDNAVVAGDGGAKGVQGRALFIDDASGGTVRFHANGANAILISPDSSVTGNTLNVTVDAGAGASSVANFGTVSADSVSIGRSGKTTTVNGALLGKSSIKSDSASAGIGYATGAGGTVTQGTSKSTTVALDRVSGKITTHDENLASGARVTFTVENSTVASTDTPVVCLSTVSGFSAASYAVRVENVKDGQFDIVLINDSGGDLAEAVALNMNIIKGVTS